MASPEKSKQLQHIIIDFGSYSIKYGFNLDAFPRFITPNVVGKIKSKSFSPIKDYNDYYCGYEALYNSASIDITYPRIDNNGKIPTNQEGLKDLESIFSYILKDKIKMNDYAYSIFIIDSIFTTAKERNAIAQILFEKFNIYNLHFEPQSIMTLYSTSKTSGLVLDSGAMTTEIVPIIEGYIISQGICNFPISGHQLTKRFENTYKDIFDINNVCNHYWMAQKIKEQFAEILPSSKEYEELISKKNDNKKEFILPDGNVMELGNEIYEIPESIFNPSIIEMETNNLPQTVVDSINKCDISTRKELFNNIVLGGGNTLLKGFETRLKTGIEEIKKRNCGIISLKERNYSSWIGGSGISSISNFSNKWIARNEYLDSGEKLFETNYLFNYGGIVGGKGRSIKSGDIREESEIYKKMLMNE